MRIAVRRGNVWDIYPGTVLEQAPRPMKTTPPARSLICLDGRRTSREIGDCLPPLIDSQMSEQGTLRVGSRCAAFECSPGSRKRHPPFKRTPLRKKAVCECVGGSVGMIPELTGHSGFIIQNRWEAQSRIAVGSKTEQFTEEGMIMQRKVLSIVAVFVQVALPALVAAVTCTEYVDIPPAHTERDAFVTAIQSLPNQTSKIVDFDGQAERSLGASWMYQGITFGSGSEGTEVWIKHADNTATPPEFIQGGLNSAGGEGPEGEDLELTLSEPTNAIGFTLFDNEQEGAGEWIYLYDSADNLVHAIDVQRDFTPEQNIFHGVVCDEAVIVRAFYDEAADDVDGVGVDEVIIAQSGYVAQANSIAASYGSGSLQGSGVVNALTLLLAPCVAFALLRRPGGRKAQ